MFNHSVKKRSGTGNVLLLSFVFLFALFFVYFSFLSAKEEEVVKNSSNDSEYRVITTEKFKTLQDNTVILKDYEVGKKNPFAPSK